MSAANTVRSNGFVEMAYVGDTPWHGKGQKLSKDAPIETWQVQAGMDWKINRSRVRYGDEKNFRVIDDQHVLFRSDTKDALGIVSKNFKIVQPGAVLEFFRDLVGANGFELETAGTLFNGGRFWALASIGESAEICNKDRVGGYLMLCTGSDGKLATTARFTTVRVVCNNTLSMALSGKNKTEVRCTHRSVFDPAEFKDRLGIARGEFGKFVGAMKHLASVKVDGALACDLTVDLLAPEVNGAMDIKARQALCDKTLASKPYQSIMDLFNGKGRGATLPGAAGTAWGWVNAVTEFVDHVGVARNADNRLNNAWFGAGDDMKTRAVELALAS